MIVVEQFYVGDRLFNRTYSDANRFVVREGVEYSEACDPAEYGRTYTEGELMPVDEESGGGEGYSEVEDKAAAYDILMGMLTNNESEEETEPAEE